MAHASDQRKRWALRVSNPRPSPCKGEQNLQVRGLSRHFACHGSALVYLGVTLSCYAKCYAVCPRRSGRVRRLRRQASSVPTKRLTERQIQSLPQ
jgi:hypothetical protein